ncbi:metallophosphoesterase [Polaribacter batillariae]|uniref:Metallophosphoesterase n=1 Tax=Polaribacter batillariae TaxID=2808900 RepID=A0ABX7SR87_9FLAO|nr:metallophosphoesterase [Polaribacter batillariae]QTD36737.1 metallophosphoesterase [Polaribacter batillariae]
MKLYKYTFFTIIVLLISACATLKMQVSDGYKYVPKKDASKVIHSFYLIGDAGNSDLYKRDSALSYLAQEIKSAKKNSTLIFLGDNVYQKGIPPENSKNYKLAKHRLKVQTTIGKNFPGKTLFIPGNHDWYSGLKGLKRQEKLVEKALGKNTFQPENGCPLEKIEVNKDINIIVVDTHWYVTNWDNHPGINDKCEIKTREKFFEELEGMIKKSQGKTTIIALHHPMFTNGPHGGYYSFKSHIKPLPIVGSALNILRKTSGITNTDQQNDKYNHLRKRIISLAQQNEKIIFVSGHEHSIQYIVQDNIPQIVSGSGSKVTATKNVNGGVFSYGTQGFARLDVYEDGASTVHFYTAKDRKVVFEANVFKKDSILQFTNFPNAKLTEKEAKIYKDSETEKGKFYQFLWGKRYRKYFGQKILAPTVNLDTLYGGLQPVRKGGGHQSKSLRLKDKNGKEYVMRALRKNAVQYLQAVAFKDQYVEGQFKKTYTESLLLDIFTGSHPYAPFTIDKLAEAIDVYHTKPILFYVPKQKGLQKFNEEFGDELYMIEARTADGHGDKKHFGFSDEIISTDDLRKNLAKDEKYVLDEASYIRARLFDMLIGDWDRHQDQWRWAAFKEAKKIVYRPVPRDRDQAFSIFSDGFLMNLLTSSIPALKGMRSYGEDLKNPHHFSMSAYPLDMRLIREANKEIWDQQVTIIQNQITDEVIESAFSKFPKEVRDKSINDIKRKLKGRRKNLQKISDKYFKYLNKFQVITGTNKDDWFEIKRFSNGDTKIAVYRIKDGKKADVVHQRTYKQKITKEIWIYGLDDDDVFVLNGKNGNKTIKLKIIGGLNNDIYEINNKKNVKVYDQKSKKNTFKTANIHKKITDDYKTNTYNYKKLKSKNNLISPVIGYNPDDGVKVGLKNTLLVNSFERNPFTRKHIIEAYYFFATKGYELKYNGEYANILDRLNLGFNLEFNSPNYAKNFFGYGNNSYNPEADDFENRNYNRVKIRKLQAGSFLKYRGDLGAEIKLAANFQNFDVERTPGRFLETQYLATNRIFKAQNFLNTEASYYYQHSDNSAFPTLGMEFNALLGHTRSLNSKRNFSYATTSLGVTHKLIPNGKLVLASKVDGHFNFGNDFEFYQAATIGGNEGLRGYRNERFTGKNAFYHTTDIRYNISNLRTAILPVNIGIYGGFDYGKVWGVPNNTIVVPLKSPTPNTSYGGGIFLNAANMLTTSIGAFNSNDGVRITFNLGFDF